MSILKDAELYETKLREFLEEMGYKVVIVGVGFDGTFATMSSSKLAVMAETIKDEKTEYWNLTLDGTRILENSTTNQTYDFSHKSKEISSTLFY